MAKRKETRSTCAYAIRDKEQGILTEFYLIDYDGEGEEAYKAIMEADLSLANTSLAEQVKSILIADGLLCGDVKIVLVNEKSIKNTLENIE